MEKLKAAQLKKIFQAETLSFETTAEIDSYTEIIGQNRAAASLEFGMLVKSKGYNIYALGISGLGKTSYAEEFAKKFAQDEPTPPDLCYVYNFDNPKNPKLLKLEPGMGITFKTEMDDFLTRLRYELPRAFAAKEIEDKRSNILKAFSHVREDILKGMTLEAKEQNFGVKSTNTGIYFMPIVNGEIISEEQFDELTQEQKDEISVNSEAIQVSAAEAMRNIKEWEKTVKKEVEDMEYSTALFVVGRHMEHLFVKYADCDELLKYLNCVKEDILESIEDFIDEESEEEAMQAIMPWYSKRSIEETFTKYKINVLTDNSGKTGAPVITEYNPTYSNLVGEVEYDNEFGNLSTDFMKIKPGTFHKANGGYLILQAHDILTNVQAWEALRRLLKTGEVVIEPLREYTTGLALSGIKPESAPVSIKVIMIGSYFYYDLLSEFDGDFKKLFKISADFDYEMKCDAENINRTIGFIKKFIAKEKSPEFEKMACIKILEYSARVAENQNHLTTSFGKLSDILTESVVWAKKDKCETVQARHVEKAISQRDYRGSMFEEKLTEQINENIIMIDTVGKRVGQINGLAVLDFGDYVFGKPTRITATSYVGKAGIVNIEKEAEMSGSIHDKGIQVIIGYLGSVYAQDFPLSLSCRICFEQNYSGVDGDSASSTELYAVLSSLANLPINQEIAVTGSIDQYGGIQPIGGVTYKVEGFFDLCAQRGLTGTQGVIIPAQNVRDLCLKDEVIKAVEDGMFSIYAICHVDEGIEILTGVSAGTKNARGKFQPGSVHALVMKRLKEFYKKSANEE
ncbi:MAG: AAA family ATPase [Clostridiales bacterium]|nr:AAA family ATPase [Clostridiales bacterium]